MLQGGYDRRRFQTNKRNLSHRGNPAFGPTPPITRRAAKQSVSVVSYRDEPTGQIVLAKDADPYAWFLGDIAARRRAQAKVNKLVGSDEPAIIDNGHSFSLQRTSIIALTGSARYFPNVTNPANWRQGNVVTTCYPELNLSARSRSLFGYDTARGRGMTTTAAIPPWDHAYYGRLAIAQLAPTRPKMNLSVALAELLREGIPYKAAGSTWQSSLAVLKRQQARDKSGKVLTFKDILGDIRHSKILTKGYSGDYLNFVFGIAPLFRDIAQFADVMIRSQAILEQYRVDAGKGVRRSAILSSSHKREVFTPSDFDVQAEIGCTPRHWPANLTPNGSSSDDTATGARSTTVTQNLIEKISFSGSFSYFIPPALSVEGFAQRWETLMGSPVSAEALWNLSPWSWLVDWFFDIDTLIGAAEAFNDSNLVMNYGYLMRKATCQTLIETTIDYGNATKNKAAKLLIKTFYKTESVERVRSNPFGFDVKTPEALTGYQQLTLGMLGLNQLF